MKAGKAEFDLSEDTEVKQKLLQSLCFFEGELYKKQETALLCRLFETMNSDPSFDEVYLKLIKFLCRR